MELNNRIDENHIQKATLSDNVIEQANLLNADTAHEQVTRLDRILAVPMFIVSIGFLIGMAGLFHLTHGDFASPLAIKIFIGLGALYLVFVAEAIAHYRSGAANMRQHWRYLLMPILRICPRDHVSGQHAWIPGLGWRETSEKLETTLSRIFSAPMIIIALLVLPVVGAEFIYADKIALSAAVKNVISACSAFIWMAFVFEFVIMFSVVEKRVRYCRQNWIDIAVILLPLVSFLGAARLGRLMRLNQLSRTAKIYRMRGLAIRAWRAIVALDVLDKILRRDPEYRMDKLRVQIEEHEKEVAQLRARLAKLERSAVADSSASSQSTPAVGKVEPVERVVEIREKILL